MEYKKFHKTITVNGHGVECLVKVLVNEDSLEYLTDQDYENETQRLEHLNRIESGEVFSAWIEVQVSALGLTAHDTLGACEIRSNNMFNSEPFESDVNQVLESNGLEENATNDLIKQIEAQHETLIRQADMYKKFAK